MKMPRTYERKFDHDEARWRLSLGETSGALAREYGVSRTAIYRISTTEREQRDRRRTTEWIKQGCCPDCGSPATRHSLDKQLRCRPCAARVAATSVRAGELWCFTCREWKIDDAFPSNKNKRSDIRRHRAGQCRVCQTVAKRAWRKRNPDYEREYQRKRRAAR